MRLKRKLPKNLEKEIERIKKAIRKATSLEFETYTGKSKEQRLYDARIIFAKQCKKQGLTMDQIAKYINRHQASVCQALKNYDVYHAYDSGFRDKADEVEQMLNKDKDKNEQQ